MRHYKADRARAFVDDDGIGGSKRDSESLHTALVVRQASVPQIHAKQIGVGTVDKPRKWLITRVAAAAVAGVASGRHSRARNVAF